MQAVFVKTTRDFRVKTVGRACLLSQLLERLRQEDHKSEGILDASTNVSKQKYYQGRGS